MFFGVPRSVTYCSKITATLSKCNFTNHNSIQLFVGQKLEAELGGEF
jgi:hypothetical protein